VGIKQKLVQPLATTGQIVNSVLTLIVGELLKLVLVERLFSLTRDKLMKIPIGHTASSDKPSMVRSNRGLANHTIGKQGRPQCR
jgi:hypothetical protein